MAHSLYASTIGIRRKGPKGCFRHQLEGTLAGRYYRRHPGHHSSLPHSLAMSSPYFLETGSSSTSSFSYLQAFLDLSSFCQLFPFFFALFLISLLLVSCLSSFFFSLSCNFFCFSASCLAFFSFSSRSIFIDSGPLTKLGILCLAFLRFAGPLTSMVGYVKISRSTVAEEWI